MTSQCDMNDDPCCGVADEASELTIMALYEKVCECLNKLSGTAVIDDSAFELELLATQLRIRLHAGVYEPSKKLGGGADSDLCRFLRLVEQLGQFISEAETRPEVVREVTTIAKRVLAREGIPFRV